MSFKAPTTPQLAPSDAVKDLLRQGRQEEAVALYRQGGATSTDVSCLTTADRIATESGISLEEALGETPQEPAVPATHATENTGWTGILWALLFVGCWIVAIGVLVIDLLIGSILKLYNGPCTAGTDNFFGCGGHWTVDEVLAILGLTGLGIALLVLPFVVWNMDHRAKGR